MSAFLSDAWIAAFNEAAGQTPLDEDPDAGLVAASGRFSVLELVRGGPDGDRAVVLQLADGRLTVRAASVDEPGHVDVTVKLTWDDAVAMASGALPVTEALAQGRVKVRGDLSVLVAGQRLFEQLQPRLVGLGNGIGPAPGNAGT